MAERRVAVIRFNGEMFSRWLTGQRSPKWTNAPPDLRVHHISTDYNTRFTGDFKAFCTSVAFLDEGEVGELPEFVATFSTADTCPPGMFAVGVWDGICVVMGRMVA